MQGKHQDYRGETWSDGAFEVEFECMIRIGNRVLLRIRVIMQNSKKRKFGKGIFPALPGRLVSVVKL